MPGIFLCYRREDSVAYAGRIHDRLVQRFVPPGWQIFMDLDSLVYGDDFVDAIQQAVSSCDVLLAVIGPHWLSAADEHGRKRLDNPEDFVRLELATALERKIRVIPALVAGTRMPRQDELPENLRPLTRRHAIEISPASFQSAVATLIEALDKALATAAQQEGSAATENAAAREAEFGTGQPAARESSAPSTAGSKGPAKRSTHFREVRTLAGHPVAVTSLAVSPDGRRAVSASSDKTLKAWDLENGREQRTLKGHSDPVNGVAVSPDGRRAVSASSEYTLKVWDLENGRELRSLKGHFSFVLGAAVSPDGRAVSASWDKTLKVWDLENGRELRTLAGHSAWVWGVAVNSDGRRAVSASEDKTLKLWDLQTGACVDTFPCNSSLTCCTFAGFQFAVAGDASGRVHVLALEGADAP